MATKTVEFKDIDWSSIPDDALWGQEGDELLSHSDIHDAIEDVLDSRHPDPIEGYVEVVCYEHRPASASSIDTVSLLEDVLERLDEEYGGPDEPSESTKEMEVAAKEFAEKIIAEYTVWQCEPILTVIVDALEWAKENAPDWLEE